MLVQLLEFRRHRGGTIIVGVSDLAEYAAATEFAVANSETRAAQAAMLRAAGGS